MSFQIIWSDFAESQLDKIFQYYVENVSLRVAKNLLKKIIAEPNKLFVKSRDYTNRRFVT